MSFHTLRTSPLVVICSTDASLADGTAERLRREGAVVYPPHSAQACLRVATSVRPDRVLLDEHLPKRLRTQLESHPVSAAADFEQIPEPLGAVNHESPRHLFGALRA